LPDATGGASLNDAAGELARMAADSTSTHVQLALPKFDIETMVTLTDVLAAMGMPTAMSNDADFSGMTTTETLHIGAVIHQANITVDEDGTEAAAATAVVMATSAAIANDEPVAMVVDRPFVFAIRDNATNTLLFVGHITDPSQTR
ncbi:MAG TPA: serpin family protein, partial [Ilumatobacteraceae bacterium]